MAIMAETTKPVSFSQTWTFFEGAWHEGNVPIMGPRTHAAWLGSTVFDGARAVEGVAPDLDRHCARVNQSAINFKLKPVVDTDIWLGDHVVALPPTDDGKCTRRLQGGLSLSQQLTRADRSAGARLQQLPDARHAGQCRGIRQLQRIH